MGPRVPRITEKFGLHGFLVLLTLIVWGALQYMLTSHDYAKEYTKETAKRQPEKHVCTQRNALQLNYVPNIETTLTTAHWFGRNGNSNNRNS